MEYSRKRKIYIVMIVFSILIFLVVGSYYLGQKLRKMDSSEQNNSSSISSKTFNDQEIKRIASSLEPIKYADENPVQTLSLDKDNLKNYEFLGDKIKVGDLILQINKDTEMSDLNGYINYEEGLNRLNEHRSLNSIIYAEKVNNILIIDFE